MNITKKVNQISSPEDALNLPTNQNLDLETVVTAAEILIALNDAGNLNSQDEVVARAFKHLTLSDKTEVIKESKSLKVIDWFAWNSLFLGIMCCFYIVLLGTLPKLFFERCNPALQSAGKNAVVSDTVKDLDRAIECFNYTDIPYTQSPAYERLLANSEYLNTLTNKGEIVPPSVKSSLQESAREIKNKVNEDWRNQLIIGFLILTGSVIIYTKKTNSVINRHWK